MIAITRRLLDPTLLPVTLWEPSEQVLILPPILASAYEAIIDCHNLRLLAASRNRDNPPVGGLTQEKADEHFAQAFDGSAARTQLALLDPKGEVSDASDAFIRCLAGNRLCLTDAPCRAGAAALAFLTTIAELRAQEVLPRQPLEVDLIGAEISVPARTYAIEALAHVCPRLEEQAIFVNHQLLHWDVLDCISNADLIKAMIRATVRDSKQLLVVANFNGFLEQQGKRKEAEPQLEELFRFASGKHSTAIWIEPIMNEAVGSGGLFARLLTLCRERWRRFARHSAVITGPRPVATSAAMFREPLEVNVKRHVHLAVMPIDLERVE